MKAKNMKAKTMKAIYLYVPLLALLTAFVGAQKATASVVVFEDDLTYTGWGAGANPMSAVWTATANFAAPQTGTGAWPASYVKLNNATIYKGLSSAVTQDFSLTMTMFSESYGRSNWFAITNSTGSSGYYIRWDGALASQYNGQGGIQIGEISTAIAGHQTNPGTSLTSLIASGHQAAGNNTIPFATITMTWVASSNTLGLWVDGTKKQEIVDASLSSFSRIYMSGNGDGLYGSVSLSTIPEPASTAGVFAVLSLGICVFMKSRKRRAL